MSNASIITKIRALISDWSKNDSEVFIYDSNDTIKLESANVVSVLRVLVNGVALGSASYNFDETTNEVILYVSALADGDIITVELTYNKYSDTELGEYIRSALVYINVYSSNEDNYEIVSGEVDPVPTARVSDTIALVSAILILPDYSQYKLSTITVTYTGRMSKETKIEKFIQKFSMGSGVCDTLDYDIII